MRMRKIVTPKGKLSIPLVARQVLLLEMRKTIETLFKEFPSEFEINCLLPEQAHTLFNMDGVIMKAQHRLQDLLDKANKIRTLQFGKDIKMDRLNKIL